MDKLLYVAMSGAKETMATQEANNYNLANANTTGFKASLSAFQSRAVTGPGFASRAYATAGTVGWNSSAPEIRWTSPCRARGSLPCRMLRERKRTREPETCT